MTKLLNLLNEDPIALERSCVFGAYAETPLHIAAILGRMDSAKEVLNRKPSLASKVDLQKSTPLHLASATDNVDMVMLLFHFNPEACLAFDRYGRNPAHIAAINGEIEVLKWLRQVNLEAACMRTPEGDTILHLCVRYNQLEALKVLVNEIDDDSFINSVDGNGNTALHLAVLDKQFEAVNFLLQSSNIQLNAQNLQNQTALDILYMKLEGDSIGQALLQAGGMSTKFMASPSPNSKHGKTEELECLLSGIRKPGMVVASVIAAATFQAGVNPPGGVWQDSSSNHNAGLSILAHENTDHYNSFLIFKTIAFLSSVTVFVLPLANLPFRK